MSIGSLIYVDDIGMAGKLNDIEQVGKQLEVMEQEKRFTFNNDQGKTHYLIIKTGKEEEQKPKIKVKKGKVTETESYKYLGCWIDNRGTAEKQIEEIGKKAIAITTEIIKIAKEELLGKFSTDAALVMYERTVVPTLTYNMECWTKISKEEFQQMEQIQGGILKRIFNLPVTTPYWGIVKEMGIWPMETRITYQRLMLYESMMKSDENRLGRKIIESQKETSLKVNWAKETQKLAWKFEIDLNKASEMSTEGWKKMVKEKLKKRLESDWNESQANKRKTRHQKQQKIERKSYLSQMGIKEASDTVKRRLEMLDIGNNLGKDRKCLCKEKETSEHIIQCRRRVGSNIQEEWLQETSDLQKIRRVDQFFEKYIEDRKEEN